MENIIINMKLTRLTYPIEYGSIFAPHPDNIYDIEPPMEENGINLVDVPIAPTIVNPNNMVNIGIIKTFLNADFRRFVRSVISFCRMIRNAKNRTKYIIDAASLVEKTSNIIC